MLGWTVGVWILASVLAPAPAAAQEGAPQSPAPLSNLFLADAALSTDPPSGTETKTRNVVATATTPALTLTSAAVQTWGSYELTDATTLASNGVVTVWVTGDTASYLHSLRVQVLKNGAVVAVGNSGANPDTVTPANNVQEAGKFTRYNIGVPTRGIAFDAGDTIGLAFIPFGIGAADSGQEQASIRIAYGSSDHPSRLTVSTTGGAALPVVGAARTLYLGPDSTITTEEPLGTESLSRTTESVQTTGTTTTVTLATASAWTWGTYTAEQDLEFADDSVMTIWVKKAGTATAMRGLRVTVVVDGTTVTNAIGVSQWTSPTATTAPSVVQDPVYRFDVGLPTKGLTVEAGNTIDIQFATWSSNHDAAGNLVFLYGSAEHPAGLTVSLAGGGMPTGLQLPSVSLAVAAPSAKAEPGGLAYFKVSVSNEADVNASIAFAASDNRTITAAQGSPVVVAGNSTRDVLLRVAVEADAALGSVIEFSLLALHEGIEVANATLSIMVVEDAGPPPVEAGPQDNETETPPADNSTGQQLEQGSKGGIPGPSLVALAAAVAAATWVAGRRRW